MKIGLVKKGDRIPGVIWKSVSPAAKIVWLANGRVSIDDEGFPVFADDVLVQQVRDIEAALELP